MEKKNFNEVLKERELKAKREQQEKTEDNMTLDNTERVKVLSPGRLVFNRFIRNKLAIFGVVVLFFMFAFSFVGAFLYKYTQTEIFYKYDKVVIDYALASERTDYNTMTVDSEQEVHYSVKNKMSGYIKQMEEEKLSELMVTDDNGLQYVILKLEDKIYGLYQNSMEEICTLGGTEKIATYNGGLGALKYTGATTYDDGFKDAVKKATKDGKEEFKYGEDEFLIEQGNKSTYNILKKASALTYVGTSLGADFEAAIEANLETGSFEWKENKYTIITDGMGGYTVYTVGEQVQALYATTYVFDSYSKDSKFINDAFKLAAIDAACTDLEFDADGVEYKIEKEEEELVIYNKADSTVPVAVFSNLAVRAYSGEDTLEFAFKEKVREVIHDMTEQNIKSSKFEIEIPRIDDKGNFALDENGNVEKENTEITITKEKDNYTMKCPQITYLIDIYAAPSSEHLFGTDGDGMDVLARMMYGGRVSLMVCFVVVILEMILGIIMGGVAGYFGGWIDTLIMRLVDVFYCIPSMPILIILGALFDEMKLEPYVRLIWLMVILGILGWAGVARLVRGQILSLREQEFMVATEAIGLKTGRRIFKHLVPNVMPQLIVMATAGLGSIIITESTLSFLGLGVKHPLATWGTMINSVTASSESMIRYTYIWVPVGLLICLTVIAFNFVGDGLRDAFDPKMKR